MYDMCMESVCSFGIEDAMVITGVAVVIHCVWFSCLYIFYCFLFLIIECFQEVSVWSLRLVV